jgi:PAS domain S-box-containing protein
MEKKREEKSGAAATDLAAREQMLDNRAVWINARDSANAKRDSAIGEREETVRLREAELEARREIDVVRAQRERLLVQLREANEKLVLASMQAQQLADDANAARAAADRNADDAHAARAAADRSADDANAARAAADENAERFRSLVLTSSALVFRATADGRFEVDREAWRKLTGSYPAEGEWGWLEAVHALDQDRVRENWKAAVATSAPYACQHRIHHRKGGYAWVLSLAVPIMRSGTVREWIGMMSDISDRVRMEEARDQFIAILGHDLRNPLAAIVAGIDALGDLSEPYTRTLVRLARSAHRIEVIIRDLLDFARGRLGGGIPVTPRACDMHRICTEVLEEIKQAHPSRSISFEGIGDLRGEWDPDRIEQVVSNLVGNAIVHGADPIVVTSRAREDAVVTTVHNQGPPIPEGVIPTLFEPFTRAGHEVQHSDEGLGLGLYIANEIVHAHGGTLTVSSVAGKGTTFTFALPRSVPRRARTTTGEEPVVK